MIEGCYSGLVAGDRPLPLTAAAVRLLSAGRPVPLPLLAEAAGWPPDRVERVLRSFPRVDWDERGRLVGLGLTLRTTPYRFAVDGRDLFTWCAMDTLLFPVLLGRPARVRAMCPATGRPIELAVAPDRLVFVEPAGAIVTEVRTAGPVDDLRSTVCDHGHFFASRADARGWSDDHPGGLVHAVAEVFETIRQWGARKGWTAVGEPV